MPHSTFAYGFEAKVGRFARELCARFTTGEGPRSFLLLLDQDGNLISLNFEDGSPDWKARTGNVVNAEVPHLFFDPLDDGREYTWLSWKAIKRSVMERLIGRRFEEADFIPIHAYAHRAGKPDPEQQFPHSWGVMF